MRAIGILLLVASWLAMIGAHRRQPVRQQP